MGYAARVRQRWGALAGKEAMVSVKLDEVKAMLDTIGLKYRAKSDTEVGLLFGMKQYRDTAGDASLLVILQLLEDGEYIKIFAPNAFAAKGGHVDAFLRACMTAQWRTKLAQFEFDPGDGEIRPMVEFPIEDGTITLKQLERCIKGLVGLLDDFYPILKRALDTGVVDFPEQPSLPSGSTGVMAQMLLAALKASGKSDTDPEVIAARKLVEELERGGSGGAPTSV